MNKPCPNPCNDCPFRRISLPGWLGAWEGPEELAAHVLAGNRYPCHLTMNSASDYDDHLDPDLIDDLILVDSTQCRGSVLFLEKFKLEASRQIVTAPYFGILSRHSFILHHGKLRNPALPKHSSPAEQVVPQVQEAEATGQQPDEGSLQQPTGFSQGTQHSLQPIICRLRIFCG